MKFIFWWIYEGRPYARIKRMWQGLHFRLEGEKDKRKAMHELSKLEKERPKYDHNKFFATPK